MFGSESPLSLRFWVKRVDPRPLALFRIGFGVVLLYDLYNYTWDFRAFLTDDGILPRSLPRESWAWSLFHFVGSPVSVGILFFLGIVAVICFTVGYRTRAATVATWLFFASLHHRNLYVVDAGDDLARILLFWSMFADLGACFSLDVRLGHRIAGRVQALPLRILQLHIALLYFFAGWGKIRAGWHHTDGLYSTLQHLGFLRPPGLWLASHLGLSALASRIVVFMELCFAPLAFLPFLVKPARAAAIAIGLCVQIGIFATLRVGIFTELMMWVSVLYLHPDWLDRAEAWWRRRRGMPKALSSASWPDVPERPSPVFLGLGAALTSLFAVSWWDPFLGSRVPLPSAVIDRRTWLGIVQPADLFGRTYQVAVWQADGNLADGTPVDVLPIAAPGLVTRVEYQFSRWYKLTFKEVERPFHFETLAPWLCRSFDEQSGEHLKTLTLFRDVATAHKPGDPPNPRRREELIRVDCDATAR